MLGKEFEAAGFAAAIARVGQSRADRFTTTDGVGNVDSPSALLRPLQATTWAAVGDAMSANETTQPKVPDALMMIGHSRRQPTIIVRKLG